MTWKIIFSLKAKADIIAAYDWYEDKQPGLGKQFSSTVANSARDLESNIVLHKIFFKSIRYVKLRRFPYTIFYVVNESRGHKHILGILHNKQDMLAIINRRVQ